MIETVFIRLIEISVTTSIIILGLRLLAPYLNKTYAAKWKYWIWLLLAVRLIIPINISLPNAPVEINIPNTTIATSNRVLPVSPMPGAVVIQPEPVQPLAETAQKTTTLLDVIMIIWSIGIVAFMIYQMAGYFIFKRKVLRWSRSPQEPRVEDTIHLTSSQISLSKKVVPLISDAVSSPLMIGFFRPLLILPCETYSDAELSFIVRHELAHCKRNDLWYKLLLIVANAIHWYNPVVYLMFHEAGEDLELSCDDVITNGMSFTERKVYTETILASIQRERMKKTALSTYFYGGQRTIKTRFINILNTGKKSHGAPVLLAVLLCTVLTGVLIACTADAGNSSADSVIREYLEAEKDKDYVISLSIEKVEISNEETARIKEMYSGSELANTKGWTNEYIAENMIAVDAKYTVDYDNTKVPYNEGELEQFFYLTRADKNAEWKIWDSLSPSGINDMEENSINGSISFISEELFKYNAINVQCLDSKETVVSSKELLSMDEDAVSKSIYDALTKAGTWYLAPTDKPLETFDIALRFSTIDIILTIFNNGSARYASGGSVAWYEYDKDNLVTELINVVFDEDSRWLILNGTAASNQSPRSDYINSKYGFTFDIPSDWENKYKVIEADESISFVYSQYEFEDENYQEFFKIVVISGDDYKNLLNDSPIAGILLAEKGEQAYILYTPLDMAIMDSQKAEEYKQLFLSIDQIKERFYLVSNTDNTDIKEIGYIRNFGTTNSSFEFDEIEWITLNDTDRINELNLNSDNDLPNGFYINNPASDTKSYTVTDKTEYQIIDWNNNGEASAVDLNGFVTHINKYTDYSPPFWIVIDNNMVISIVEQYIP